jgi:hypothetical protein
MSTAVLTTLLVAISIVLLIFVLDAFGEDE